MNEDNKADNRTWLVIGGVLAALCIAAAAIILTVRSTQTPVATATPVPETAAAPGAPPGGPEGNAAYYQKQYGNRR